MGILEKIQDIELETAGRALRRPFSSADADGRVVLKNTQITPALILHPVLAFLPLHDRELADRITTAAEAFTMHSLVKHVSAPLFTDFISCPPVSTIFVTLAGHEFVWRVESPTGIRVVDFVKSVNEMLEGDENEVCLRHLHSTCPDFAWRGFAALIRFPVDPATGRNTLGFDVIPDAINLSMADYTARHPTGEVVVYEAASLCGMKHAKSDRDEEYNHRMATMELAYGHTGGLFSGLFQQPLRPDPIRESLV
ncbi:hypothetical protein JCM3770_000185 [Rhodotorula araucariae]